MSGHPSESCDGDVQGAVVQRWALILGLEGANDDLRRASSMLKLNSSDIAFQEASTGCWCLVPAHWSQDHEEWAECGETGKNSQRPRQGSWLAYFLPFGKALRLAIQMENNWKPSPDAERPGRADLSKRNASICTWSVWLLNTSVCSPGFQNYLEPKEHWL